MSRHRQNDSRHAALVRLLDTLRVAFNGDSDRRAAIQSVLHATCRYLGWPLGHAYLLDPSSGHLAPTMIWHEAEPGAYAAFIEATAATRLSLDEGLPGRTRASRKPEWVSTLTPKSSFLRADAARAAGIRTGVGVPLMANGDVHGMFEFFAPEHTESDPQVAAVLEYVGSAWSRALELDRMATAASYGKASFKALVQATADAIIVADERGRIVVWNPSATRMFGYPPEEAIGEPLTMIMPEQYRGRHRTAFAKALAQSPAKGETRVLELEGLSKDGRTFPVELSIASWSTDRKYFAGILRDVTMRRAAMEELRLHGSAAEHVSDAIVVSTADSRRGPTILYVNHAFTRMTGYSEAEALGRSFGLLAGPKTDGEAIGAVHESFRRGEATTAEILAYRKDGTEFLLEWRASPIPEADGSVRHFASIQRDVTEDRRVAQALLRADRDPLTDLANREVLEKRLLAAIEASRERPDYRFGLLFMDLDGFKVVNDTHGHVVGDQLLISAARRLEHTVRPGDTLARFGGDEFVILLDDVEDVREVEAVAERVRERLAQPFEVQRHRLQVAASIGVTLSDSSYGTPREAIRDADAAMYVAKRKGKGRIEFHDAVGKRRRSRDAKLRDDLHHCLERDELEVHYQPLVDLRTEAVFGFEALVRWRHAELGLLPPERFIPLAEESGLIVPIGRWVLREACHTARRWRATGPSDRPLLLSVNLSVLELSSPDLIDEVRRILEETSVSPSTLQLELTESILADPAEPVQDRVSELRALGVAVCIDDFGSGYSSLGYLQRFPIDAIKIDQVFVQRLGEASASREILQAIVTLAHGLGLDVVVEGIETRDQLDRVRDLTCKAGQGFLFARPIPGGDVEDFLLRYAHGGTPDTSPHGRAKQHRIV